MSDIFRRFFGFHNSFPENWSLDENNDQGDEQDPFHSLFSEPNEMFRHFERHFEQVFKNFGFMDFNFPSPPFNLPEQDLAPALPPADDIPLRDQFLKRRPDCAPNPGISVPYSSAPPENDRPNHWFKRWFEGSQQNAQDHQMHDSDLDNEVSTQGLNELLKESPGFNDIKEPTNEHSYFRSSSMTITGADGKIEKRFSKTDSLGNRETSVTRQYGDRIHTFISRRNRDGQEEHEENFVNMDEKSKDNFEQDWNSNNGATEYPTLKYPLVQQPPSTFGNFTQLFKDLFR